MIGLNQGKKLSIRNSPNSKQNNQPILPGIKGANSRNNNENVNPNANPIYMSKGADVVKEQKNYLHQKKIL